MRYTEKWTRRLQGDYQVIYRKLVKASHLLSAQERDEMIEALAVIGNAIGEIAMKVGDSEDVSK